MLIGKIKDAQCFYIYGAQVVAYGAYVAIKKLCGRVPAAFLVGRLQGNPKEIDGVPVEKLEKTELAPDVFVLVAVTELLQDEIVTALQARGITNYFLFTAHEEHLLMSAYFDRIGKFPLAKEETEKSGVDIAMYEVRNHRDKPLTKRPPLQAYEHTIQAGAVITEERVAPLLDNTGVNISAKNKQYCEMTATYWVWKNTKHAWTGIEHYRRHLLVTPAMMTDDVDAILPFPYLCWPNTLMQFRRFVGAEVVDALLRALKTLHPGEYAEYESILNGPYQYTYNLVCARREAFEDYCTWFFHITENMETMADTVPVLAETRALSYVAEVLTNLYFMSHNTRWNIRHAEKAIYV